MVAQPINFPERLDQEREQALIEQGRREGSIDAKLDTLLFHQRGTDSILTEIQKTLAAQSERNNYLHAEMVDTKTRLRVVEVDRVTQEQFKILDNGLKALAAEVHGFWLKLAIAGLGAGGAGASLYAAAQAMGLLP